MHLLQVSTTKKFSRLIYKYQDLFCSWSIKTSPLPWFSESLYFSFFLLLSITFLLSSFTYKEENSSKLHSQTTTGEENDLLLHFIVMEPPPGLLRRSAVFTLLYIAIIIIWALLQSKQTRLKPQMLFSSKTTSGRVQLIHTPVAQKFMKSFGSDSLSGGACNLPLQGYFSKFPLCAVVNNKPHGEHSNKAHNLGNHLDGWTWEHGENADTNRTHSHGRGPWIVQNIYKPKRSRMY